MFSVESILKLKNKNKNKKKTKNKTKDKDTQVIKFTSFFLFYVIKKFGKGDCSYFTWKAFMRGRSMMEGLLAWIPEMVSDRPRL